MALSLVFYEKANRWATPEIPNISPLGSAFQFMWRLCVLICRMGSMALFATTSQVGLFVFIACHWVVMTVWIMMMVRKDNSVRDTGSEII